MKKQDNIFSLITCTSEVLHVVLKDPEKTLKISKEMESSSVISNYKDSKEG